MPCSCQKDKAKTNQSVSTAITAVTQDSQAQARVIAPRAQLISSWIESDSTYDFTPTTEPMDTCAYCAMKHIALASSLTDLSDYFSAAGQMQLAAYHYNTANTDMAQQCRNLARLFITAPKEATAKLPQLLIEAMKYPAQGDTKQTNPGQLNYDPVASMVHLAAAQALMFTEIFYQQLNKAYAVGELIVAAVNIQMHHRDIARNMRSAWKVIQEIQEPNDQHYKKAQQLILQCKKQLQEVLQKQIFGSDSTVQAEIVDNTQGVNAIPVN